MGAQYIEFAFPSNLSDGLNLLWLGIDHIRILGIGTGTSLQWRLMRGNIIEKRLMSFTFEKTSRISLSCMLVPVQYREYEYGLLHAIPDCKFIPPT